MKVEEMKVLIEEKAQHDIEQLEAFVEVAVSELAAATASGIDMLDDAIEDAYESVEEASEALDEFVAANQGDDIALLSAEVSAVAAEPKIPSSSYVYAGMGLAGVGVAAYLLLKKSAKNFYSTEVKETLINDEEFVQV